MSRPRVPRVNASDWAINPIDLFILAELENHQLSPAPPARRETLLRRVTLDLTGLPPTREEREAFLADRSPDAYPRLIDRLLASPQYGERWGRHWLDLARFAESDGFEHDAIRPHAWRYRDYVIRSLNEDKPYDRFIREQVAGDELFADSQDALVATAFNLLGPDMVDSSDQTQRRHNVLNDMTDTISLAFLGLTMGCARCHDHKFEPLTQTDYYRLQAFFNSAVFRGDLPIPTPEQRETHERAMKIFEERKAEAERQLANFQAPYRQQLLEAKLANLPEAERAAHLTPSDLRTEEQKQVVGRTAKRMEITEEELLRSLSAEARDQYSALRKALQSIVKPAPLPMTQALQQGRDIQPTHVLFRGNYQQPREEVTPGLPAVLGREPFSEKARSSRADLADWITDPRHPLTARVMVNRLWQHHFGRGLVRTPSDFGWQGQPPTHPALLDWLAHEFVNRGWSLKAIHRLMLMSATYRQASQTDQDTLHKDPENLWYSRWQRQRVEGEVVRDCLLAISGRLNPAMGGPGVFPAIPAEVFQGASGWKASANEADQNRRSIYIFARRNLRFPFLEVFDAPDNNLSCPARGESTTAPQSLTLLNAEEVITASRITAERLRRRGGTMDALIEAAYLEILGRAPTARERELSRDFLAASPLHEFCRALFNLNAFVYVD